MFVLSGKAGAAAGTEGIDCDGAGEGVLNGSPFTLGGEIGSGCGVLISMASPMGFGIGFAGNGSGL